MDCLEDVVIGAPTPMKYAPDAVDFGRLARDVRGEPIRTVDDLIDHYTLTVGLHDKYVAETANQVDDILHRAATATDSRDRVAYLRKAAYTLLQSGLSLRDTAGRMSITLWELKRTLAQDPKTGLGKITVPQLVAIEEALRAGDSTYHAIATEHGVSDVTVRGFAERIGAITKATANRKQGGGLKMLPEQCDLIQASVEAGLSFMDTRLAFEDIWPDHGLSRTALFKQFSRRKQRRAA